MTPTVVMPSSVEAKVASHGARIRIWWVVREARRSAPHSGASDFATLTPRGHAKLTRWHAERRPVYAPVNTPDRSKKCLHRHGRPHTSSAQWRSAPLTSRSRCQAASPSPASTASAQGSPSPPHRSCEMLDRRRHTAVRRHRTKTDLVIRLRVRTRPRHRIPPTLTQQVNPTNPMDRHGRTSIPQHQNRPRGMGPEREKRQP